MRRSWIAFALVGAAACGSRKEAKPGDPPATGTAAPSAPTAPSAPRDAAAAVAAPTIDAAAAAAPAPAPAPAPAADDTAERLKAAQAIVKAGTNCIPEAAEATEESDGPTSERELQLGVGAGAPVLCQVERGGQMAFRGPLACWSVDAATGALSYREPAPVPGVGTPVVLDARGCAYGFCLPGGKAADNVAYQLAWSTNGQQVAMLADDLLVFDAASKQLVRKVSYRGEGGVSNDPFRFFFVKDVLFVWGRDAGPAAMVWAFSAGEQPLAPTDPLIKDAKGRDPYPNVYSGTIGVLDDHRVLVVGGLTAVVADVAGRTVTDVKRNGRACKNAEYEAWLTDDEEVRPSKKCAAYLRDEVEPLMDASVIALPSGEHLVASGGKLLAIDARTLKIKRTLAMPHCPP